jgi:cobalt-zinc-cadmium efflux system outer membrane protein
MTKILFASLLFATCLNAENFEQFLENALKNSPYLQATKIEVEVVKEQNDKLLRYENPSIGVDYERFDPEIGREKDGYSINISQPIRLWGVGDDKKELAKALIEESKLDFAQKKALFIYKLSLSFTEYKEKKSLLNLAKEEIDISKKIYKISKSRFDAGNIAQKELLKAENSLLKLEAIKEKLELEVMQSYYKLHMLAGLSDEIELDTKHTFKLEKKVKQNLKLKLLQNRKDINLAKAKVDTNIVESISLNANYEKESEQDISSIGFSLPLALFNTKSQERRISKLKAKQLELLIDRERNRLSLRLKTLKERRRQLFALKNRYQKLKKSEVRVLNMLKSGYRISKSDLLELQYAKNTLINTKKELISIDTQIDRNIIESNYLRGAYYE